MSLLPKRLSWNFKFLSSFAQAILSKKMAKVNLIVTSTCNSRCQSCHIWRVPRVEMEKDLTVDEYTAFFEKSPKSVCWLSVSGGEPFLRRDLAEILRRALRELPRLSLISITTNGLNSELPFELCSQLLNEFPRLRLHINLSLDGDEETHDALRGVRNN